MSNTHALDNGSARAVQERVEAKLAPVVEPIVEKVDAAVEAIPQKVRGVLVCNAIATVCYAFSFIARLQKKRATGMAWGTIGTAVALVGGYLGSKIAVEATAHDSQ